MDGPSPLAADNAIRALHAGILEGVPGFAERLPDAERLGVKALFERLAGRPERLQALQHAFYRDWLELWSTILRDGDLDLGVRADPETDSRFAAPEWRTLPFFRFLRASYELNARWLRNLVALADLPAPTEQRLSFAIQQLIDALAPTNFPIGNPEVIRLAFESAGASLRTGLANLQSDIARGAITMSEPGAYEVGRNLAVTPGAVVHENDIAQLIQYAPRTEKVRAQPLLIVPPFINKFYILDLQPHNSFVRHALAQGFQVFMVSWRNPTEPQTRSTWADYVVKGVHEVIRVVLDISAARRIHVLGFCVGGTLLASALAVLPKREPIASLTLLATLLDFQDVGPIGHYIDETYVRQCEQEYAQGGLVSSAQIAASFASLRANELVWFFVVNNYLKGRHPKPFDLLQWNSDSTNAPGPLFAWYLRNMYLENRLIQRNALELLGQRIDLTRLDMPAYILATEQDHIVPWKSAYASARCLSGPIEFVLGASGHVAGIVNPPCANRRHYWLNPAVDFGTCAPDAWLTTATRVPGSWWTHWAAWMSSRSGPWKRSAKRLGSKNHPIIEPAPGRYVRAVASDWLARAVESERPKKTPAMEPGLNL